MSALDDLRKKYNLESEEYYNALSKHLEDQKYNKKTEAKNYANQYKKEKNILNQYQNTMQQEQRKLGIKSANELIQESWQEKTKLPVKTLDEIVNIPTKNDFEKFKDNQNKIDSYNNSNTKKEYDELQNQNKYTRYMKDLSEIDLENTTFSDKINIINQFLAGLEGATSIGDYKDENGNLIKLPSRSQLKAQKTSQDSEFIFKAIQSAANSLGAMTPAMIAGLTGIPGLSEAVTYATTLNSAYNEKVLEGYSKEQARNYGLINAGLETFLGKVLGGTSKILTGKESVLSNSLGKLTDKLFNNKGLSYFISHLTSEEIEENLQTILDPINEYITLGKYDTIGEALSNISGEDIALTALSTLITIGVTEGPTAITKSRIDKINKQYNTDIELKANENSLAEVVLNNKKEEKNTNESTRVEEENKEKNVNISDTVNEIQQQVEEIATGLSSETITNSVAQEQLTELQNGLTVLQRYNEQQSNALTTEALDRQNQEISILSSQINELQQAMGINQSPQLQQIEDKTAFSMPINKIEKGNIYTSKVNNQEVEFNVLDVANDKALIEITKSTLPTQQVGSKVTTSLNSPLIQNVVQPIDYINNVKYTPEIQKNINELVSTANTYLNKTQKANDIVKLLQKIIVNKGYSIRFNPNITNEQGVAVNGLIRKENGTTTIELNPNADNYVEFLIVHEITHDIATEEMKELILDYAKQDPNFNNALESLKEKYNTDDVTDEVVADVCAELFGNKEFIQSVAEKKPSLFKKILNNIRELAKKIKGLGANEYVSFVEKLKVMWEDAYYSNKSNLKDKMYSIQQDSKGNKYVEVDTNQDIFEGKSISEQVKIAKQYILDNFRKNGIDINNENIKVTSKTANEYTHPKNQLPTTTKSSKMKASTELDNLLLISNYKYSKPDDGRHQFAKDGWDYYETTFKVGDNLFNGLVNIAKSENKKTLYDITNIKRIDQNRSTSANAFTTSLVNSVVNNIPQSNSNVNSDTSSTTKYSIPINKNNTQIKGLDYAIDHLNRSIELDNEIAKDKKEELNEKIKRWYDRELESYKEAVNDGDIPEENLKDFLEHFENGNNIPYYEVESWQQLYNDGVEPFEGFDALVKEIEELEQSKDDNSNQNKILSALNETIDYLSKYFPKDKIEVDYSTQSNSVYVKVRGNEDTYTLRISDHHTPHYSYQGQWHDINNTWEHRIVDDYDKKASQSLKDDLKEFLDIIKEEEGGLLQFSQNTKEWNEYLKENFPSSGTKTKMSEIKAPIREDIKKNEIKKETSIKNTEELAQILKERPITLQEKDNWLRKLATIKFIDKGYYVDKLARQTKNKELSSKYDYSLLANGIANQIIGNGRYDENGKKIGKGLFEIFEPIENSGLLDKFSEYIYHKHNIDRMSLTNRFSEENKAIFGNSVTEDISKEKVKELELQYPEFETWAEDIYSYNKANLEYLEKYGVLSKESVDYYNKKYPHYVPTIRDTTKTKTQIDMLVGKKARINTPIKKAKGGNQDIIPLKEAMALRTMQTINSALKNNFGLELMNTIETEVIKTKQDIESVVEEVGFEDLLSEKSKDNPATLTIFENGEKVTFAIPDEIYEALKPSNIHTFKSLNKLNNIRRGLLTEYNPTFMITNPLKDIQDGSINSKHPKQFAKNLIEAVKQIKNNGQYKKLYIANGGAYETYFNYNTGTNIAPSKLDKIIPLKKISEANEIIEMTPRLAEFISSIEAGESIETAMYNAAEITTNFKRGGDFVKTLDRNGVTFLNAGVQGMVKQVRNIQEAKVQGIRGVAKLIVRSAVVGLVPTLIMGMIWDDDDDYNELSDYIKNNYYIIGKYDNGKFIKIPKGRILSILQSLFQNMINGIKGEKLDIEGLASLIENQLLPSDPTESNLLSPITQAINNKTWYGGELVPKRLQNLPDGEQYDETTDSISIWLGKKLNLSPYKINYVLDQYSGALGDYILPYLTQEAESGSDSISGKIIAPIKDKFTTDSVLKNKNVSELYELSESYTKKANSSKSTDEDIIINKYINSVKSEISKLYAEKRKIQSSDLKDSEKFNKARDIQNQINEKAKDVLSNYNEVQIKNNYASVGNRQYYKNNKNEWQKVDNTTSKYKIATQITSYDKFLDYDNEIKKIKENSTNKKTAIINYVNSLELSIPQKAMLIKMNYSSFDNYDGEIRKYIDSKNLTNKEKQELYKDLKL